ncbi:MAG TPA: hypothetical protein ENK88_00300 [Campylobacterales bacterium]|nr:hypothetical protein [Campylobacterales bacterium]
MAIDDRDMKNLIENMDLYLELIKIDLPELREENRKASSNLQQLVIESRKVTNLGKILVELKEIFQDIQKRLSEHESQVKRIELIANSSDTLKNRLNIIYALIFGALVGYTINILPI